MLVILRQDVGIITSSLVFPYYIIVWVYEVATQPIVHTLQMHLFYSCYIHSIHN